MTVEFDGRHYDIVMASDVIRDGMGLELWDVAPAPGRGLVAEAFWSDTDGVLTFTGSDLPVPFEVLEHFAAQVRPRLTPVQNAE